MEDGARILNNPLIAGSAHVSGTSALRITIEQDTTENEITKPEAMAKDTEMTDTAKAEAFAGMIKSNVTPLLITDRHLQAGLAENIRVVVQETLASTEEVYTSTLNMLDQASHALKAALDNASANATKLSFKLFEFAQSNIHNNIDLASHYISVRSLPDVLELQSSYIKRQFDLFIAQVGILQTLTAQIANENVAPFNAVMSQRR